jgi:uncharacterized membrane protein
MVDIDSTVPADGRVRYGGAVVVAGLLLLAAALRLWGLATKSLWVDEILAVEQSRVLRQAIAHCLLGHEPPLRYFLLHVLIRFEPTELFIRLPSFVSGTATVAVLWLLVRRLFGWREAIVAAALLAVSPWHIVHSQDARMYAVMMFFWALSLLVLFAAIEHPRNALLWPALAAAHAINYYLSYLTVFVLGAEALAFAGWLAACKWHERDRFVLRPYAIGALIFAGFFGVFVSFWLHPLPLLIERYVGIRIGSMTPQIHAVRSAVRVDWPLALNAGFFGQMLDRLLLEGTGWNLLAFAGLVGGLALCTRRKPLFGAIALLSFGLTLTAILTTEMRGFVAWRYLFHWLLFAIIAFSVAVVAVFDATRRWIVKDQSSQGERDAARTSVDSSRMFIHRLVLVVACVAVLTFYLPGLWLHVSREKQDWKSACRYIAEREQPDDLILTGPWGTHAAVHYYGPSGWTEDRVVRALNAVRVEEAFAGATADVWLITWGPTPEGLRDVIDERFPDGPVAAWQGLQGVIVVYHRKGGIL